MSIRAIEIAWSQRSPELIRVGCRYQRTSLKGPEVSEPHVYVVRNSETRVLLLAKLPQAFSSVRRVDAQAGLHSMLKTLQRHISPRHIALLTRIL